MRTATLKRVAQAVVDGKFPIYLCYGVWRRQQAYAEVDVVNSSADYERSIANIGAPDYVIIGGELIKD